MAKLFKSEINLSETSRKVRTCDADVLTARNTHAENSLKSKTKRRDAFPLATVHHKIDFANEEISTVSDNSICPMAEKSEPQEDSFPVGDVASTEPKQLHRHVMVTEADVILCQSVVDADNAPSKSQECKSPSQPEKPVVISLGSDKAPRGNRIKCNSTSKPVNCIKTYKIRKGEVEMDNCSSSLLENISNKCARKTDIISSVEEYGMLPSIPSTMSPGPKRKPIPFIDEMDHDEVSWRESNVCI